MRPELFTASLLRASSKAYAGLAASRLFERAPACAEKAGFEAWQGHLDRQVLDLASAIEDEAPDRFSARVAWSRDAFAARAEPVESLAVSLECLEQVLLEHLPEAARAPLVEPFRHARSELSRACVAEPESLGDGGRWAPVTARYLELLLAGDEHAAADAVLDAVGSGGTSPTEIIRGVLAPVQREIGRRWHLGDVTVAEEHFASQATRKLLAIIVARSRPTVSRNRTVVVASVAGEAHDLGLAFVAASFELDGWRALCLGSDTPIDDLVSFVVRHQAQLVALGATLDITRSSTAAAIRALRVARPELRILVGGPAYQGSDVLWQRAGADAFAADAAEAVRRGRELVAS